LGVKKRDNSAITFKSYYSACFRSRWIQFEASSSVFDGRLEGISMPHFEKIGQVSKLAGFIPNLA
jgi:hypothetical protein